MNKEEQKQILIDIMNEDQKDGLYDMSIQSKLDLILEEIEKIKWMIRDLDSRV
jgi:hypothetical protein